MDYTKTAKGILRYYKLSRYASFEVVDGEGTTGVQHYREGLEVKSSGIFFLGSLRKVYREERKRYTSRFGVYHNFKSFFILTVLHELCHVRQVQGLGPEAIAKAYRTVFDKISHDENVLEIEADTFARTEFSKLWRDKVL